MQILFFQRGLNHRVGSPVNQKMNNNNNNNNKKKNKKKTKKNTGLRDDLEVITFALSWNHLTAKLTEITFCILFLSEAVHISDLCPGIVFFRAFTMRLEARYCGL